MVTKILAAGYKNKFSTIFLSERLKKGTVNGFSFTRKSYEIQPLCINFSTTKKLFAVRIITGFLMTHQSSLYHIFV